MRLINALRLDPQTRLALVGAGGKTSALFRLAKEFLDDGQWARGASPGGKCVLLTATTHLAIEQTRLADRYFPIHSLEDLEIAARQELSGVVLFTGPQVENERVAGLSEPVLEHLFALAEARRLPLLVEADGSRRLPLKAPAAHEPLIPAWARTVVVVAGLSALGKPLTWEWVHRPEIFAQLAEQSPGEVITPECMVKVLTSPQGGLKGVPPAARRIALLNQADTLERQAAASQIARRLLGDFHAAAITVLSPPARELREPETAVDGVQAVYEPIAGVVLAAGGSSRLGRPKQLLPWRGKPFVWHVAQTALRAGLSPVIVVTGFAADETASALQGLPVSLAFNPSWQEGQGASVAAGVKTLPEWVGGAVFLLADQPQIPTELVASLVEMHTKTLSPVIAPLAQGQRGNPALFDRVTFDDLRSLSGEAGGRALFSKYGVTWLPWLDSSILLDVDTEEDYRRLLEWGA
ncbi:MAG: selenium cofactor biosynthesis protein YqeC [Anaerolineales bacterium]|nr:selenium cofactor biosynthesis protein YqeC [Anaerolineales bacterium]